MEVKEFQIQHYAYEDKNYHAKLMSEYELNSRLKRDEIKKDSWKRINEDEMSSFDNLDETKAKRKLHAYDKEAKAKSKIPKELFLIKRLLRRKRQSTKAVQ